MHGEEGNAIISQEIFYRRKEGVPLSLSFQCQVRAHPEKKAALAPRHACAVHLRYSVRKADNRYTVPTSYTYLRVVSDPKRWRTTCRSIRSRGW